LDRVGLGQNLNASSLTKIQSNRTESKFDRVEPTQIWLSRFWPKFYWVSPTKIRLSRANKNSVASASTKIQPSWPRPKFG